MSKRKGDELLGGDQQFLHDLSAMYRAIQRRLEVQPTLPTAVDKEVIRFGGFDARSDYESKLSRHYPGGFGVDSHAPREPLYRVLVSRWHASADRENLTIEDVARICSPPFFAR